MKTIYLSICFLCINTVIYGQYVASTVEQVSSAVMLPSSVNNPVIRIKIDVGATPIDLNALFWNTTGSTNPLTDIDSTNVFYTGNSNIFSTSTSYMGGIFPLPSGTNYFWVAYDISATAIVCDTIDAECPTVYVTGGTQTPSVTDPTGYAVIGNCLTGINSLDFLNNNIKIYPNPFSSQTTLQTDNLLHNATLTVDNYFGQTVKQIKNISGQTITLHRDNLSIGLYFVRLTQDNKVIATDKLIITD